MNDGILAASLDQSLLALQDVEDGENERALVRSQIAQALAAVAAAETSKRHIASRRMTGHSTSGLDAYSKFTVGDEWLTRIKEFDG